MHLYTVMHLLFRSQKDSSLPAFCSILVSVQSQAADLSLKTQLHLSQSLSFQTKLRHKFWITLASANPSIFFKFYPVGYVLIENWVQEGVTGLIFLQLVYATQNRPRYKMQVCVCCLLRLSMSMSLFIPVCQSSFAVEHFEIDAPPPREQWKY